MDRPSLESIYMRLAVDLALRSTCKRASVGVVVTTWDLQQILAIGYNGNARGFANTCDSDEPGACGCVHAEVNALIKCGRGPDGAKKMFTSVSPCLPCAKMIINCGFDSVYFHTAYRKADGLKALEQALIKVIPL